MEKITSEKYCFLRACCGGGTGELRSRNSPEEGRANSGVCRTQPMPIDGIGTTLHLSGPHLLTGREQGYQVMGGYFWGKKGVNHISPGMVILIIS